ncbi:MAG: FAD-dependent oxidoreductase [Deltaproteobacteria bacterium]|nr:FAD-dependent oxidoreductase [Deltaproteobacteria bacterium]MBW2285127.1 FAD-dependent oxidoreductase [Deltaproteobacteria bacterium]
MAQPVVYSSDPADFYYMELNVPCQGACPVETNIPAYIRAAFEEKYGRSYEVNVAANVFPGVLGRICSRPCETRCRHGEAELGQPVNICHIKRAAADMKGGEFAALKPQPPNGKRVAVIGAGPAGLAAARDMALGGMAVTVFERRRHPGGMLRYGIPEFRLPRRVLEAEIEAIANLGVEIRTGVGIGVEENVESLLKTFDAVLLSTGCSRPMPLNIPGESLQGVYPGLTFMMDVCSGNAPPMGKRVLVMGAGFTAFDCARSALRLGAESVTICLRRTEQDLAVTRDEVLETKKEGVRVEALMLSQRILGDDRVEGVEFVRTRPGEMREDGKQSICPIEGSAFTIFADTVIIATGQRPEPVPTPADTDKNGITTADTHTFKTSVKGLYAAGDFITGPSTVIESVAAGRHAAEKIVRDLTGKPFREKAVRMADAVMTDRDRTWDFIPRQDMPTPASTDERIQSMANEVETGLTASMAREESKRCYLCYLHYEIDMERCIYCRYCMDVAPRDCIKLVKRVMTNELGAVAGFEETTSWRDVNAVVIDNARCIRCGECVRVCPVDCISVTRVELTERMPNRSTNDNA